MPRGRVANGEAFAVALIQSALAADAEVYRSREDDVRSLIDLAQIGDFTVAGMQLGDVLELSP